jgi:hypothetical protein
MDPNSPRNGRRRKSDGPSFPRDLVDRLLVHGEPEHDDEGNVIRTRYPTYAEVADRFGCAVSLIGRFAKQNDVVRRRTQASRKVQARVEQKLVETRASAVAMSRGEAVALIDEYVAKFREALAEGRVRTDNPSDVNTMLRLKEFLLGGADSRQEIHQTLTLEAIRARHREYLQAREVVTVEMEGTGSSARETALRSESGEAGPFSR